MEPVGTSNNTPITVFCGVFRAAWVLSVETKLNADVGNVRAVLGDKLNIRPHELNLYLAKKNSQWVKADENLENFLLRRNSDDLELERVWPLLQLSTFFEPKPGVIHLLVELPQHHTYIRKYPSLHEISLPDFKKSCNKSGLLPRVGDFLKVFEWDDCDCGDVKDIRAIGEILGFTGLQFYVRKEILCVLASFKNIFHKNLADSNAKFGEQFILMGSPGTGKSCIAALICFYFAIEKHVPVVWHRKNDSANGGLAVTRLFDQGCYYEWVDLAGHAYNTLVFDSRRGDDRHCMWVCLDGFTQKEVKRRNWGTSYSLLAASGQFAYDPLVQQMGLLPYWRRDDLEDLVRKLEDLDESEFASRYFVSGGNLRDFLLPIAESSQLVEFSMRRLTCEDAAVLLSECKDSFNAEFDRIRMMGVPDRTNVEQYIDPFCWKSCITSDMAIGNLVRLVKPDYFLKLVAIAKDLNDSQLQSIALEHFFHSVGRYRDTVGIFYVNAKYNSAQLRNCVDNKREDRSMIAFKSEDHVSVKREGAGIDDYVAVMKRWAANPSEMDYWVPVSRVNVAIDAVAKWELLSDAAKNSSGGPAVEMFCLLQAMTDAEHKCDISVLSELAKPFLDAKKRVCYMVLQCDTSSSGFGMRRRFRLNPDEIKMDEVRDRIPMHIATYDRPKGPGLSERGWSR